MDKHIHAWKPLSSDAESSDVCDCGAEKTLLGKVYEPDRPRKQRVVVCAANRSKDGMIICGARHWDNIMRGQVFVDGKRPPEWLSAEQGFIDQYGVFMNRKEARQVADAAGQIKYPRDFGRDTLYSEDLY